MKRLFMISLLVLAASCAKTEVSDGPAGKTETKAERLHFHGVARVETTRGVAQMDKLWHNGTTVLVKFLNGAAADHALVQDVAAEWEQHANIRFRFVESGDAHVRIHFDVDEERWVTWAYTGTDCKFVTDQTAPTAFFSFWEDLSDVEKYADSRRVFGQILGLELEHRHLDFDPGWRNESAVENNWAADLPDMVWDELSRYVFEPLDEINVAENIVQTTEFDPGSIMIWPFPRNVATNNDTRYANEQLSDQDIAFIKQLYPPAPAEYVHLMTMVMGNYFDISRYALPGISGGKNVKADFGNGILLECFVSNLGSHMTYYSGQVITVWGESDAIESIAADGNYFLKSVFISEHAKINTIEFIDSRGLESFDIPYNPFIEVFRFSGTLECIDLTGMPALHTLDLYNIEEEFTFPDNFQSLQNVSIGGSIITNVSFMTDFVNALPDRTGLSQPGLYQLSHGWPQSLIPAQSVLDILASKNWISGWIW